MIPLQIPYCTSVTLRAARPEVSHFWILMYALCQHENGPCCTTEVVSSSKCQGKLWLIAIQGSEFSGTARVSIPVKDKDRRELFPFTPNIHRLELTCPVFLTNHKWCHTAENQNTSCYSEQHSNLSPDSPAVVFVC